MSLRVCIGLSAMMCGCFLVEPLCIRPALNDEPRSLSQPLSLRVERESIREREMALYYTARTVPYESLFRLLKTQCHSSLDNTTVEFIGGIQY